MATEGLRTLCVATAVLHPDDYVRWNALYEQASVVVGKQREARVRTAPPSLYKQALTLPSSLLRWPS
jgi:hypothetical protein